MRVKNQTIKNAADDQIEYGIHLNEKKGIYCTIGETGAVLEISNFKINVLYRMEIPNKGYRIIRITNIKGEEAVIRVKSKTLLIPEKFIKKIAKAGDFLWLGNNSLKCRLVNYIISK